MGTGYKNYFSFFSLGGEREKKFPKINFNFKIQFEWNVDICKISHLRRNEKEKKKKKNILEPQIIVCTRNVLTINFYQSNLHVFLKKIKIKKNE